MQDRLGQIEQADRSAQRQIAQATQSTGQQGGGNGTAGGGGRGQGQNGAGRGDVNALQERLSAELRRAEDLQTQMGGRGGGGRLVTGTAAGRRNAAVESIGARHEAFEQDFAKWGISEEESMNDALEQTEMSLARKLAEKQSQDRLNTGADNRAPDDYEQLVNR